MAEKEIFVDRTKNGKIRPWRENKIDNITYAEYLDILHFKKAHNVIECGQVLRFKRTVEGHLKLFQTWFCKSRLCPLCAWRRSMKNSNQLVRILESSLEQYPKGRFLFLTLSTENTRGSDELKHELQNYGIGFNRLIKYKKVAKNLLGYVRTTEITVNKDDGSYNQHMHVLLFVSSRYFKGDGENYISQDDWRAYWKKAMKLDYSPVVNVKSVHAKKGKGDLLSGAQETAKYQVKSADYISDNAERDLRIVEDLEEALNNTRAISYGGIFKEIRKELKLEDENNLIDTDDSTENDELTTSEIVVAKWNYEQQNYFIE